jgi:hypothetical protein
MYWDVKGKRQCQLPTSSAQVQQYGLLELLPLKALGG